MKKNGLVLLIFLLLLRSAAPVSSQSGMGGGTGSGGGSGPGAAPGSTGIFAVASPAAAGRIVTVGGRIVPVRKIVHNTNVPGYVDEIMVKVGDRVQRDQPLISLRRDAVGETFQPLLLQSRLRGVVSEIHVYKTEEMKSGAPAVTILDDSSYLLKTSLSDRDFRGVRGSLLVWFSSLTLQLRRLQASLLKKQPSIKGIINSIFGLWMKKTF